ncbi:uncharacterized protein [Lolium perenne]|uniref:uncharacterized protein n=1 Tax=Lolium perenne TaxID=4522 RepID=UPI0021F5691C|nr:uncharacterized protein LOC127311772 isoform X2 [Lolium perenne]XP_051198192.1 uncharacterized protein LOC127311772 isoform X2 [Lolium perenne]
MDAKTTTAAAIMRSLSKLKLPGTSPTLSSRQRGEEGPRGGCRSTRRMRPADSLLANLFTGASAVKAPYAQLKDPAGGSKDATAVGNTALSAHTEESGQPRARGDSSYRRLASKKLIYIELDLLRASVEVLGKGAFRMVTWCTWQDGERRRVPESRRAGFRRNRRLAASGLLLRQGPEAPRSAAAVAVASLILVR